MDAKQFLAEFRHIASAPGGVQRVRELILSLAFQGSLCEHDANNVSNLFTSLEQQRLNYSDEEQGPRKRAATHAQAIHPPYSLPEHWRWLSLSEVGHGWGQKKPLTDFTYIDVSSIDNQRGVIREPHTVLAAAEAPSRARKLVRQGTVIYSTIRPYLLNIALVDREFAHEPIASTAFAVIHPWEGVLSKYIYYYLRCPQFITYVQSVQTGMAYPAISDQKFFSGVIPIPPTTEQQRIVAKVDELMALCDKLEAQQQECEKLGKITLISGLDRLISSHTTEELRHSLFWFQKNKSLLLQSDSIGEVRRATLELAANGKLVANSQTSAAEYMAELVQDFKPVKVSVELAELIPHNWCWARFEQVAYIRSNLTSPLLYQELPHIAPNNIERNTGKLLPYRTVAEDKLRSDKHHFYPGHILYSKIRPNLNKLCLVDFEGLCSADMYPIEPRIDAKFLMLVMQSNIFLRQATQQANRVAMPKINQIALSEILIPVPPPEEQKSVVKKISQFQAIFDDFRQQLDEASSAASLMATSAVVSITGIRIQEQEEMKFPKTELVSNLRIGISPTSKQQAPLASILARNNDELPAKTLWDMSNLEIDHFYQQLKMEIAAGWIVQPEPAYMKEVGAS